MIVRLATGALTLVNLISNSKLHGEGCEFLVLNSTINNNVTNGDNSNARGQKRELSKRKQAEATRLGVVRVNKFSCEISFKLQPGAKTPYYSFFKGSVQ